MLRRCQDSSHAVDAVIVYGSKGADLFAAQKPFHRFHNIGIVARAEHTVDLRQLLEDLLLIALRQAACYKELSDKPLLLHCTDCDDVVDRLLLCRFDESAGVDDDDIRAFGSRQDRIARRGEQVEHLFGVHLIFCTAE